ncbi:hypothetical protein AGOR_G00176620 [Albula goreensis]|uniref:Cadherin domain-containing protein n=1 Tax=Albula goreensis TaxID=1534307 RepID=A0A8T3D314_9TELE|nr:hypothetical protein AGOR_G00176620 [Albula goreensis]
MKRYPISIKVKNMPDGPKFDPAVKPIPISEDDKGTLPLVLTKYPAVDGDSGLIAEGVRYAKAYDPGNWLTVDENTAEIKLAKTPDRESKHVVNGTYYAKILCITDDLPSKTATGTIALQIEDINDSCPELTVLHHILCTSTKEVIVTAHDGDGDPNSAPFTFKMLTEGTTGPWDMEVLNDTSVILKAKHELWPYDFTVAFEIKDQQGLACPEPEVLDLTACECANGQNCSIAEKLQVKGGNSTLGSAGIGALLSVFLVLLLVPLLMLLCSCGSGLMAEKFAEIPFDAKDHLIPYHTEGQGEDKEVPLLSIPATLAMNSAIASKNMATTSAMRGYLYENTVNGLQMGGGCHSVAETEEDAYEGITLPDAYLEEYYSQKASSAAESHPMKDMLLVFDYEGQGSAAGSVACSSELEVDNDLGFLDDLSPKFTTLAEICKLEQEQEAEAVACKTAEVTEAAPLSPVEKVDISNTALTATFPRKVIRKNIVVPNQAYVVQQPMYYAAAPVIKTHYVVQPQVRERVVIANSPPVQSMQVVMQEKRVVGGPVIEVPQSPLRKQSLVLEAGHNQGVIQIGHSSEPKNIMLLNRQVSADQVLLTGMSGLGQGALQTGEFSGVQQGTISRGENVVLQERRVMSGPAVHGGVIGVQQGTLNRGENVVLVERNVGPGQVVREGAPGVVQMGNLSGSQIMLVEGQMGAGQVLQGGQSLIQQGTLQRGPISGSQNIVLVERQGGAGQVLQEGMLTQGTLQRQLSQGHDAVFREEGPMLSPGSPAGIMGLNGGNFHFSAFQGSHKIVVKEEEKSSSARGMLQRHISTSSEVTEQ